MEVKFGALLIFFGVLLLALEFHLFTAYIFPAGLGLIVSGIYLIFFKGYLGALVSFLLTTLLFYYLSFKYIKRVKGLKDVLDELKSQEGVVIGRLDDFTYQIRFPLGAAGEEVWNGYCEEELNYGDRVRVVGIRGNKLVVKRVVDAQVG